MELTWLHSGSEILVWSEAVFVWALAAYAILDTVVIPRVPKLREFRREPSDYEPPLPSVRDHFRKFRRWYAVGFVALTFLVLFSSGGVWLALTAAILLVLLDLGRHTIGVHMRLLCPVEVVPAILFPLLAGMLVASLGIHTLPLVTVDVGTRWLSLTYVMVAVSLFATRGGSNVVGGILDIAFALPKVGQAKGEVREVDEIEYRRGRWIGYIERLLMIVAVAAGQFAALAVLVAAKALMRPKEMDELDYAEFFLLGSLASALVGLACGFLMRLAILRA